MRVLTRELADGPEIGTRIALDHTIAHLDADLRWMEQTRDRVAGRVATVHAQPDGWPDTARPPDNESDDQGENAVTQR